MLDSSRPIAILALAIAACVQQNGDQFTTSSSASPGDTSSSTGPLDTSATSTPATTVTSTFETGTTSSGSDGLTSSTSSTTHELTSDTNATAETTSPASCGDHKIDPGEECDDGNQDDSDACTMNCKNAFCGDGIVQAGEEECDDGDTDTTDSCPSMCKNATCGDGFIQAVIEECDDPDTDKCNPNCTIPKCGDGILRAGEECDDGPLNSGNDPKSGSDDGILDDTAPCSTLCKRRYRFVFISSVNYSGTLGGISGANKKCTDLAKMDGAFAYNQDLKFRAWLSTQDPNESPSNWLNSTVPYVLPDRKTIIAQDHESLLSGIIKNAISLTEKAELTHPKCYDDNIEVSCRTWTNTSSDGKSYNGADCGNWNTPPPFGTGNIGDPNATDQSWTYMKETFSFCGQEWPIYCFEHPPL